MHGPAAPAKGALLYAPSSPDPHAPERHEMVISHAFFTVCPFPKHVAMVVHESSGRGKQASRLVLTLRLRANSSSRSMS
eukprot:6476768-Amphidinium_carterae.1